MKFILISSLILFSGCSVKGAEKLTYDIVKSNSKSRCGEMVYQGDQIRCVDNDRFNHNEYEKYYDKIDK